MEGVVVVVIHEYLALSREKNHINSAQRNKLKMFILPFIKWSVRDK